ncbi:MAG TPA: PspA/IM30 family protein [Nitrospinota bacterium]|jgi:phage shock protein A|nr:PspA/IM30 family protein [Nitrospinota bacterium]
MASIFQRLFKVGQSHAHEIINQFEDPIKMTEQGIRDLKKDLQGSMKSLAEVKGITIRMKKDAEDNKRLAADYERKAMLLLQKMQKGELDNADAERLATEALKKKEDASQKAVRLMKELEQQKKMSAQLQGNVDKLKSTVTTYENDLITLRARAKTAAATRKVNEQMAKVDSSGTISMLEKMKAKVEEDESLAQSYGELASADKSIDDELNAALGSGKTSAASDSLAALKSKMGI